MNTDTRINRALNILKRNKPVFFTPIEQNNKAITGATRWIIDGANADNTRFICRTEWVLCLLALCGIAALTFYGLATVQITMQHEAKMDASAYDSAGSLRVLSESFLASYRDGILDFGSFTEQGRISDNIRVLNQKSIMLDHLNVKRDPIVTLLRSRVETLLRASCDSKYNIVQNEKNITSGIMNVASELYMREMTDQTKSIVTRVLEKNFGKMNTRHSVFRRDARFTATTFGVGSLYEKIFDSMSSLYGEVSGIMLALIVGPVMGSHLNVANFIYRTVIVDGQQNIHVSIARFLFADSIFLLPNLVWICMLVHLAPLVSPLVFIIGHYVDREIYAIGRSTSLEIRGRLLRYKFLIAIRRASRRLKNIILGITYIVIITAAIGALATFFRSLDVTIDEIVSIRFPFIGENEGTSCIIDGRSCRQFARMIFMTPSEFSARMDSYSERLSSSGITVFDTYQAVAIRMILSSVACLAMYMTLPPVCGTRQEGTMIEKFFRTAGSFLVAHTFLVSSPRFKIEGRIQHFQRRDGAWSQMTTFFRVALLTVNAFPYIVDFLPVSGGEACGIVDLITCVILAYAATRAIGNLYEKRDAQTVFWSLVFTVVILARHASAQHGILVHTSELFGLPHPAQHGNLFPIVGHARMERGLLAYIFDLTDLKTMSHLVDDVHRNEPTLGRSLGLFGEFLVEEVLLGGV